jgi:hypothetical protein
LSQHTHLEGDGALRPLLSVILPTCDDYSTIRRTVRALNRQTIRERIELVIVAPVDDPAVPKDEVAGFARLPSSTAGHFEHPILRELPEYAPHRLQ